MIQSFADKRTAAIFAGLEVRRLPSDLQQRVAEKLALRATLARRPNFG